MIYRSHRPPKDRLFPRVSSAAIPVTQFFAIFWNHLYARISTRTYLVVIGMMACMPLALIGTPRTIWEVMIYFVLAALGGAGGVTGNDCGAIVGLGGGGPFMVANAEANSDDCRAMGQVE